MNTVGQILRYGDKTIFSFGTAEVPVLVGSLSYKDTYHIGVDLDTGKFDDIQTLNYTVVPLHDLEEHQQVYLTKFLPVLHALRKRVMTVSAKARSGKDYLADRVKSELSITCTIKTIALGDSIRSVRDVLFGQSVGKDRAPLIMIGQGLRKEDPNIWIKVWLRRVSDLILSDSSSRFICPDVRQPNEFTFFRSMGALTVKVVVNEEKRLNKIREVDGEAELDTKLLNDETESHANGFDADIIVENDYTPEFARVINTTVVSKLIKRGW